MDEEFDFYDLRDYDGDLGDIVNSSSNNQISSDVDDILEDAVREGTRGEIEQVARDSDSRRVRAVIKALDDSRKEKFKAESERMKGVWESFKPPAENLASRKRAKYDDDEIDYDALEAFVQAEERDYERRKRSIAPLKRDLDEDDVEVNSKRRREEVVLLETPKKEKKKKRPKKREVAEEVVLMEEVPEVVVVEEQPVPTTPQPKSKKKRPLILQVVQHDQAMPVSSTVALSSGRQRTSASAGPMSEPAGPMSSPNWPEDDWKRRRQPILLGNKVFKEVKMPALKSLSAKKKKKVEGVEDAEDVLKSIDGMQAMATTTIGLGEQGGPYGDQKMVVKDRLDFFRKHDIPPLNEFLEMELDWVLSKDYIPEWGGLESYIFNNKNYFNHLKRKNDDGTWFLDRTFFRDAFGSMKRIPGRKAVDRLFRKYLRVIRRPIYLLSVIWKLMMFNTTRESVLEAIANCFEELKKDALVQLERFNDRFRFGEGAMYGPWFRDSYTWRNFKYTYKAAIVGSYYDKKFTDLWSGLWKMNKFKLCGVWLVGHLIKLDVIGLLAKPGGYKNITLREVEEILHVYARENGEKIGKFKDWMASTR